MAKHRSRYADEQHCFSVFAPESGAELLPLPGCEITGAVVDSVSTVSQLRRVALGAEIDEALFVHMASAAGRSALAASLLQSCFSEAGQRALFEQNSVHGEAFRYSRLLEEAAHSLPAESPVFPSDYKAPARDQGFRRAIVLNYDHRCAFCGTRIVTSEGHTVVDAAPSVRQLERRHPQRHGALQVVPLGV